MLLHVSSEPIWSIVDEKTLRELEGHEWFNIRNPQWQIYRILVDRFADFHNDPLWQQIVQFLLQDDVRDREVSIQIPEQVLDDLLEKRQNFQELEIARSERNANALSVFGPTISDSITVNLQTLLHCVIRRFGSDKALSSAFSNIQSFEHFSLPSSLLLDSTERDFMAYSFGCIALSPRKKELSNSIRGLDSDWKPRLNTDDLLLSLDGALTFNLKTIDLTNSFFNPMLLESISSSLEHLEELNMSSVQMPITQWGFLRNLLRIKRLVLKHLPANKLTPQRLLTVLAQVTTLESLDLSYSDLDVENNGHLIWPDTLCTNLKEFRYLQKLPNLSEPVTLENEENNDENGVYPSRSTGPPAPIVIPSVVQAITDTFLTSVFLKLSNLEKLHITVGPKVTMAALAEVISLSKISDLGLDGVGYFLTPSNATNRLMVQLLAPTFSITSRLNHLRLTNCSLNDDVVEPLLKSRKTGGEGLKSLKVSHNHIGGASLNFLLDYFDNITSLDISYNDIGIDRYNDHVILARCIGLRHLDISHNPIVASRSWLQGSSAVAHLSALGTLTKLQSLAMGGYHNRNDTGVDDMAIYQITTLTQLEHLDLRGNLFTDAAINKLQFFTKLSSLNLDSNYRISAPAIRLLSRLTNLKTLSLRDTHVSDSSVPHLLKLVDLQTLDVRGSRLSLRALSLTQFLLPHLEILSFVPPSAPK